jgi:hypothetical protein
MPKRSVPQKKSNRKAISPRRRAAMQRAASMQAAIKALYELAGIDPERRGVLLCREEPTS